MHHGMVFHENRQEPIKKTFPHEDDLEIWLTDEILAQMRLATASGVWAFWLFKDLRVSGAIWRVVHEAVERSVLRNMDDWEMSDSHPCSKRAHSKVGFGALHFRRRLER